MSAILNVLKAAGVAVCILGVGLVVWGVLTYEKPDYTREEDRVRNDDEASR